MAETIRIAVLGPLLDEAVRIAVPEADVVTVASEGSAAAACRGAHVVVGDYTREHVVTDDLARILAPTCRLVQVASAGLDAVDVEACRRNGIPVGACIGTNAGAVAEWAVWAILDGLRGLSRSAARLREGTWDQLGPVRLGLAGRTVGIVGLGTIGSAVVRRLRGFEATTTYWSRTRRDEAIEQELGATWSELDDLFETADVVVVACALTDETRGLVSAARIGSMQRTAVLVNLARGEIVDQDALATALAEERLHAAVLDVFEEEPVPPDEVLVRLERFVGTPHVAGVTVEAAGALFRQAIGNVVAAARGQDLVGLV